LRLGSRPSLFVAYTSKGSNGIYSLYSAEGQLVVDNLDKDPNQNYSCPLKKYYKKIEKLGWEARHRYLIVQRSGDYGVVADGRLLHEPTLTWRELWQVIKKDWEVNKPKEDDSIWPE